MCQLWLECVHIVMHLLMVKVVFYFPADRVENSLEIPTKYIKLGHPLEVFF